MKTIPTSVIADWIRTMGQVSAVTAMAPKLFPIDSGPHVLAVQAHHHLLRMRDEMMTFVLMDVGVEE